MTDDTSSPKVNTTPGRRWIEMFQETESAKELLSFWRKNIFLDQICRKYHYPPEEKENLSLIFDSVGKCVLEEGFFSYRITGCTVEKAGTKAGEETGAAAVVITLGEGIDRLQEEYTRKELLSECYMAEVIAGELLLACYPVCNQRLKSLCGLNVERYSFIGSSEEYGLEMLPEILNNSGIDLCCNHAYYIVPKKSVAFFAHLTVKEDVTCSGVCVDCGSINCPNRIREEDGQFGRYADLAGTALNYGFTRIFGRKFA